MLSLNCMISKDQVPVITQDSFHAANIFIVENREGEGELCKMIATLHRIQHIEDVEFNL